MRYEVINADTIDEATERILDELRDGTRHASSRNSVIYFDGWDGLGASAVLRAVASKAPAAGLGFDQIIHIDCSKWKNKRALQRVLAEQLELPDEMMDMFDRQDGDDDFNGVAQGSRAEIPQILEAMYQHVQKLSRRFLLIVQNWSSTEIDLTTFGFPLYGYSRNKVLWTFQGNLRLCPRTKVDRVLEKNGLTDVFISASCHEEAPLESWWAYLVRQEAEEVACRNAGSTIIAQPELVSECFMYLLKLCWMGNQSTVFCDSGTHISNYLVCDGIIQGNQQEDATEIDQLWKAADALHREVQLDVDYYYRDRKYSPLVRCAEIMPSWSSPTYRVTQILDGSIIPNGDTFQKFNKLCILMLSHCNFSFSLPPFLCCNNLRFLLLNHCQDQTIINADGTGSKEEDISQLFQKLWVLDMRYTCCDLILSPQMMDLMAHLRELNVMGAQDWDMGQLQGRLPNVRKLRVRKSTIKRTGSSSENDGLFSRMQKMEVLDFTGNHITSGMKSFSMTANNSLLETVIIDDGCVGLEQISFRGCANLKTVLLGGLFEELKSIDISGTAVKTLDLTAMAARNLDQFIALDCGELHAILWPPEGKRESFCNKLRISTTTEGGTSSASSSLSVKYGSPPPTVYYWFVSVTDARILRSLEAFKYFDVSIYNLYGRGVHMEISSPALADGGGSEGKCRIITTSGGREQPVVLVNANKQQPEIVSNVSVYQDVVVTTEHQESSGDDGDSPTTITQIWPCPRAPDLSQHNCYMYIQDRHQPTTRIKLREKAATGEEIISTSNPGIITVPDMVCFTARILHVHDSKFITTCVPGPPEGSRWHFLYWCRVERCPRLDSVFFINPRVISNDDPYFFPSLQTLWSSQLPRARCIWSFGTPSSELNFSDGSFQSLTLMHVDLCPRLTHVLPLTNTLLHGRCLRALETVEIVWCGDLRAIFPLVDDDTQRNRGQDQQQHATTNVVVKLLNLKRIHLHELPMLHGICGRGRLYAPNLESIKVRGCWSLTRLPAVGGGRYKGKVECDCEKEWWENLKWDGMEHKHDRSLYRPTHPRHYKQKRLKGFLLV